ncbi:MAG TPA: hypothetical protein VE944_07755 [Nostoc sp.]|uniref:hypothetical protein n=1 Tax=Nostoc sp. TaxID=1180 RepID=UPI002D523C2F|nr:hypothetical protein [Nostoc sp.]HYX14249.1 hypothetical protein [Nostoc sp.]
MQVYAGKFGKAALAQLAKGTQFDIAILDMQMSEMDGITLAQKLPLILMMSSLLPV